MISLLMILLLTMGQLITGFGVLTLCRISLKPAFFLPLCILLGIAMFSLVPFGLQLLYIPVTGLHVFTGLLLCCLLLNMKFERGIRQFSTRWQTSAFRIKWYELPFLAVIALIVFVSVWRCFYFPPTPVDATSGAEAIAEYTIREKTMLNSVFHVEPNGNTLKPPFLTSLQIIYKYAGFPFGQVWLSNVFICFTIILYYLVGTTLHRLLTGMLMILFLAIPEMYAYSFMMLYDYSNAVFFFLSIYFITAFFRNKQYNYLAFAGLLMGIATYIRPEMPVLAGLMLLAIIWHYGKQKAPVLRLVKSGFVFLLPTALLYIVSITLYIGYYLPTQYSIAAQVNPTLFDVVALFRCFVAANRVLIFSEDGIIYYAWYIFIFLGLLVAEAIVKRRFQVDARNYLYAVLVVYLAYPALNHLLPGMSIEYTVKRAYFKMFPLMLLYMSNNALLTGLSARIGRWEKG